MSELFNKVIPLLRAENYRQYSVDCSVFFNGTEMIVDSYKPPVTVFETKLLEIVSSSSVLQMYPNSTYNVEYFVNVMIFGRDGNNLPLLADESPVLTELATVNNDDVRVTPNVSMMAPRRFYRIGVAEV